ncbi:hypothetical protein RCL1_005106 [Eukaryota sp. TZLM3-RCL]
MRVYLLLFLLAICLAAEQKASVVRQNGRYVVVPGHFPDRAVAWATYDDKIQTTGWGMFNVETSTSSQFSDHDQMFAIGMLEGFLTNRNIWDFKVNMWAKTFPKGVPEVVTNFLRSQDSWIREMMAVGAAHEPFWYQVSLSLRQLEGMTEGYNQASDFTLTYMDLLLITAEAELIELLPALNVTSIPATLDEILESQECSAILRLSPDKSQMYLAHNTWTRYSGMIRIYKSFSLNLRNHTASNKFSYPSRPGYLFSKDDSYLSETLWVTETTISIHDESLYRRVADYRGVPTWIRAMVALRFAKYGEQWTDMFKKWNSGTYCNQWVVVDRTRWRSGYGLIGYGMMLLEQIPGFTYTEDISGIFNRLGYFPMYNIPFNNMVYQYAGYPQMKEKFGDQFDYAKCPRAQIFKREAPSVDSFEKMKTLMRLNEYKTDPLSQGNPKDAIAARYDLHPTNPRPYGAVDAKVTMVGADGKVFTDIISGPTTQGHAPFEWAKTKFDDVRQGVPEKFDFDWIRV